MTPRTITTLALVIVAAAASGCGADEETKPSIPRNTAQALEARLDEVQRRFDVGGGACTDIVNDSQPSVESILASMPSSVDPDVRSALEESFDHLFELSAEQCDDQEATTPTETETVPTTETTETTETQTTDTTTTETTPTETTTTETTPTTPPQDENDGSGGAGPEE